MAIIDNRTLITANNTATNIDDLTGSANGGADTEFFVEGTASVGIRVTNAVDGLLYDWQTNQDHSNKTFYIWWNVSTAGKLDTLANGGVRVRFTGEPAGNYFEVHVAGNDTYTGGFTMTVIDIERARAAAVASDPNTGTGGTVPATSSIRRVGIVYDIASMVSGNVNNCFLDAMWELPQNTPGIRVEGQNTGSVDWTWQDIVDAADDGDPTKAWGTVFRRDGVIFINTPIRFGANDAVTHGFSDSNEVVAWEDQFVDVDAFYALEIIGGSGTQSFQLGEVTGTGDDRVGTQGGVILAPAAGARWNFTANDANIDTCNLYGTQFIHGAAFSLDSANTVVISCTWLDCTSALVTNGLILRGSVINANTADGVAFMTTDDLGDIRFSSFLFSDGHAIELTTPRIATQTSAGNLFDNYGITTSNDAAVFNDTAGAVTINVISGGDSPTYRDGTSASTTVNNNVQVTLTGLVASPATEVRVLATGDTSTFLAGQEDITTGSFSFSLSPTTGIDIRIVNIAYEQVDLINFIVPSNDVSIPIQQRFDRNYVNL